MDWIIIVFQQLALNNAPVLPQAAVVKIALVIFWAVALVSAALFAGTKLRRRWQWLLSVVVGFWVLWPGSLSPTYWLGLAFQLPSWTTVLLCAHWSTRQVAVHKSAEVHPSLQPQSVQRILRFWVLSGIVIGWVLLADSFALFGASLYHWGFGSAAVAVLAAASLVPWLIWGGRLRWSWDTAVAMVLPLAVLTLFVATRLPTGNVWDALLDPWLWVALQARWIWVWWLNRGNGD